MLGDLALILVFIGLAVFAFFLAHLAADAIHLRRDIKAAWERLERREREIEVDPDDFWKNPVSDE